jgi:hypothetical protein
VGALSIAFDTIIVGALALPWVYLVIHLFFFEGENRLHDVLDWIQKKKLQTVAAVLLFSMTYTLGSSLERVAQDFFNDDDLRIPHVLFMAWTENRIIASVYCESDKHHLVPSPASSTALSPALKDRLDTFRDLTGQQPAACDVILNGFGRRASFKKSGTQEGDADEDLKKLTWDIFGLEENNLLLKGEDDTLRLRQLHDQIMVLRGATFNGLIAFALCLFAWGVRARREKSRTLHWVLAIVPAIFLLLSALALYHHLFVEDDFANPPYLEFSLFVIGGGGALLLWRSKPFSYGADKSGASSGHAARGHAAQEQDCILNWKWGLLSAIFAVLFVAGVLGWWATEVLYAEQVIYSYDSQVKSAAKPPTADVNTGQK